MGDGGNVDEAYQIATSVKSGNHSAFGRGAFGRGAWNCRFAQLSGQGAAGLLTVVRTSRPRMAPCRPICRIRRATVHRATVFPSRPRCRQTLCTLIAAHCDRCSA